MPTTPASVFLSYSQDSPEHAARVKDLARQLQASGLTVALDQAVAPEPEEGWSLWCRQHALYARTVLVVCSTLYKRRWEQRDLPSAGLGVGWEAHLLRTKFLHEEYLRNPRMRPVLLAGSCPEDIPIELRDWKVYRPLESADDMKELIERIKNASGLEAPAVDAPPAPQLPTSPMTLAPCEGAVARPPMNKHIILFLAANPIGTDRLALDREASAIQHELERRRSPDCFEFVTRWATEPLDLLRELRKLKPSVVHFSGNGGHDAPNPGLLPYALQRNVGGELEPPTVEHRHGLYFQDRDGKPRFVNSEALRDAFGAVTACVKLVVLSACYSEPQAQALLEHVDFVVGIGSSIGDDAARSFAIGFYGGLGECESVAAAYKQGRAAIRLENLPDDDRPQLKIRAGLDADHFVLAAVTSEAMAIPGVEPSVAPDRTRPDEPQPPPASRSLAGQDALPERGYVRRVNDGARIGLFTGRTRLRGTRRLLQVQFPDEIRWEPDGQLELVPDVRMSPLDMLEAKQLGRPVDLRRTLTHVKLSGHLADVIYSMEATNTAFHAYQFKPVLKILESPSNGLLIADEVGLGKTIEAGLIWTELRSRFDMRRLLVLCPAALREKWRRELSAKFGVAAAICNAGEVLEILRDEEAHARGFAIIASLQGLRPPSDWEASDEIKRPTAELARFLLAMENEDRLLDLLIVDEAHHLRNPATKTSELGQLVKSVAEYTVLLTATPIHNRNEDMLALLSLLDPDTFKLRESFEEILRANAPLIELRDLILNARPDAAKLRALLDEARSHPLLATNRQLAMISDSDLVPSRLARRDVRSRIAHRLETVNLLAHVVTRTRKRDVKEWRIVREPIAELVELDAEERRYYGLVTEVVIGYARDLQRCTGSNYPNEMFLLTQPQRQMTSSMAGSLRAWQRKLVELEQTEQTGHPELDRGRRASLGPLATEIVRRSRDYVDLDRLIEVDTKYQKLKHVVLAFLANHPAEKIIIFSSFLATLGYLAERLNAEGISCIQLRGDRRERKDDIIARFRHPDGPSILLSSEVGSEGVDLQFSRIIINYDLPWNPMKIEQRIGRIDRLGQDASKILIWNILYADTLDAKIYKRLYEKLDLCRMALGDFEAILGEEVRKLTLDLLSGHLSAKQQEQRIDQTAQALENLRGEEQRLEEQAAGLIAHGNYILSQIQAARDLHRWVTGEDLRRYVFDHLGLHYPQCELRQVDTANPVFEIELTEAVKFDLEEFIRAQRLPPATRLTSAAGQPVRCRFDNRVTGTPVRGEEIISQLHPLIRMVSHQINKGDEQITPAVALMLDADAVDPRICHGTYVLAVMLWSCKALQNSEKLAYAASVIHEPEPLLDAELAERLAVAALDRGRDWLEARNVIDLDRVFRVANDILLAHLEAEYERFAGELRARNEDRADLQLHTLDQHSRRQTAKLQDALDRHRSNGHTLNVRLTEGRIRALAHRVQQQQMRIEARRQVRTNAREIAIAIIRVGEDRRGEPG